MNSPLFQDFNERSKEVSQYFIFLKNLEQESIKLRMEGRGGSPKIKEIAPDLLRTLKASGFLLLYNLVEATMRNAIEAIFDELKNEAIQRLCLVLSCHWLRNSPDLFNKSGLFLN